MDNADQAWFEQLVVECANRFDREGEAALADLCARHPQHADALRRAMAPLIDFGLAGPMPLDLAPPVGVVPSVPDDFGDYTIEHEIGRGGMGIVFAARQRSLDRRVALKLLSRPLLPQARAHLRFQREARLLARLEHRSIVRVLDAGMVGDVPYYAMDLVDGAPLSAVIDAVRRHGLPTATGATVMAAVTGTLERTGATDADAATPAAAALRQRSYLDACAELGAQVADALAFAHAAGVVHRDVKPSNVLLGRDGAAVLTDFGLARQDDAASMTLTGEFVGTAFYMSPEQARGEPVDHRTDVYSLGVLLYELVTLQRPFAAGTTAQVLARIQRQEPLDPKRCNPGMPDDLAAVVLKAMAKEPGLRYASAGDLAADLRACLLGEPVMARRPSRWQRLRRFARREPWRVAAMATAAAAAAVVIGLSIGFTGQVIAEREHARANLDQAMRVVDEFLSQVGRQDLAHVPQMSAVRRDLLQRAVRFYEGFLTQRSRDPRVQLQLANARDWLGWVRYHLGDFQGAVAAHREAIADFDTILGSQEANAAARAGRATAQVSLGAAYLELGQGDVALAQLDEAIGALQGLPPGASRRSLRSTLARGLILRGQLLRERRPPGAKADVRAAIAELEQLLQEEPQAMQERAALVSHRLTLATLEISAGNTGAAELLLTTARDDAEQLAASAPEHVDARRLACLARDQLAVLYHDTGRPEAAVDNARAGVERWQKLVADFPLVADYREHLGRAWSNLAGMRRLSGDRGGAGQAAREAIAVQESLVASCPDVPRYRYRLVRALITSVGECADSRERDALRGRALELAEVLHRDQPERPDFAKVLADALVMDGSAAREQGDRDHARRSFLRATEITAAAATRDPDSDELRDAHAHALRHAAEEAAAQGDGALALELLERGLADLRVGLQKEPRHPSRRRFMRNLLDVRVQVLVTMGNHEVAASTLAERAAFCDSAQDCYAVAVASAIAARSAAGTHRDALVERGLLLLQECVKLGLADADRLDADPDLSELRADPRFAAVRRAMAAR